MANGLVIEIIPLHLVVPTEFMNEIALATNIPQTRKKIPSLDLVYVSVDEYRTRHAKYLKSQYARNAYETPHIIGQLQSELRNDLSRLEEEGRKTIGIPRHLRNLWTISEETDGI